MFQKFHVIETIRDSGNILIVRLDTAEEAFEVASAAVAGGIRALEITLSIPGALTVIERLTERFAGEDVVFGAGTVLDGHAAWSSIQAGAQFLVSPNLNPEMIRVANRYQVATISGAYTPTEILETAEAGADIVKLFPPKPAASRTPRRSWRRSRTSRSFRRAASPPPTSATGSPQASRRSEWAAPSPRPAAPTAT